MTPELLNATFIAIGGTQLVLKVLGPTAEYIGEGMRDVLVKRQTTTQRILENAEKKLGDNTSGSGSVPPRVIKEVIDEGSFCEDDIAVEYFGGVLASSRTDSSRDDRSVVMMKLISRLSTFQLRTHYMLYAAIQQKLAGETINFSNNLECKRARVFMPIDTFIDGLEFAQSDASKVPAIGTHVWAGLYQEGLIQGYEYGCESINKTDQPGMYFIPTLIGIELFLSAHGMGDLNHSQFLTGKAKANPVEDLNFDIDSCVAV